MLPCAFILVLKTPPSSEQNYGVNFNHTNSSFTWTSKKEPVRDLLMHPTPPWHITNSGLVCLPVFWFMVIYTCRNLRDELRGKKKSNDVNWVVDAVAINFGQWETAGAKEKYALDCHGHAHFLLSLDFIDQCDDGFFAPLRGRQNAPPNYLYENLKSLEDERLLRYEMIALQQDARSCLTEIRKIQDDEAQRNEKINKMLELLESSIKTQDNNQASGGYKSLLRNRYSSSYTNIYHSYLNSFSNMTYSYSYLSRDSL